MENNVLEKWWRNVKPFSETLIMQLFKPLEDEEVIKSVLKCYGEAVTEANISPVLLGMVKQHDENQNTTSLSERLSRNVVKKSADTGMSYLASAFI